MRRPWVTEKWSSGAQGSFWEVSYTGEHLGYEAGQGACETDGALGDAGEEEILSAGGEEGRGDGVEEVPPEMGLEHQAEYDQVLGVQKGADLR